MLKKFVFALILVMLLFQFAVSTVWAADEPAGGCPPTFELHMAMEHGDHQHHHQHVGTDADLNGDGYICVRPLTPTGEIHVHIDNNLPLP